jgi:hypothetical protein
MGSGAMRQAIASAERVGVRRATMARTRHRCVGCQERRSVFMYRGVVKADADHTLCMQCYRGLKDRTRASRLGRSAYFSLRRQASPK